MSPSLFTDPDFGRVRKCGFLWSFRDSFLEDLYRRRMALLLTDDFTRITAVASIISALLAIVCGEDDFEFAGMFCLRFFLLSLVAIVNALLMVFYLFNKRPERTNREKKSQLGTDADPEEDLSAALVPPRTYVFPVWLMVLFSLWVVTIFALTIPPIYEMWEPPHLHHNTPRGHDHEHSQAHDEYTVNISPQHHSHTPNKVWQESFFYKGHTSRFFFILNDLGNLYAFRHHVTVTVVIQVYTAIAFLVVETLGHSLFLGDKLVIAVLVISLAFTCLAIAAAYVMSENSRVNVCHMVQFFQNKREAQSESRQVIEAVQCFGCATLMFEGPVAAFQETALLTDRKDLSIPDPHCRTSCRNNALWRQKQSPPARPPTARCTWASRKTSECAGVAVQVLEAGGLPALVEQGAGHADKVALGRVCSDSLEALVSELEVRCDGFDGGGSIARERDTNGGEGKGVREGAWGFGRLLFRLFASREKGTMWSVWENTMRDRMNEALRKAKEGVGRDFTRDSSFLEGSTTKKTDIESGGSGGESAKQTEDPYSLFGSSVMSEPIKMVSAPGRFFEVTAVCRLQQQLCELGGVRGHPHTVGGGQRDGHLRDLLERGGVSVILTFRDVTRRVMEAERAWGLLENFASMLGTAAWQADYPIWPSLESKQLDGPLASSSSSSAVAAVCEVEPVVGEKRGAVELPEGAIKEKRFFSSSESLCGCCESEEEEESLWNSSVSLSSSSDRLEQSAGGTLSRVEEEGRQAEPEEGDLELGLQSNATAERQLLSHPPIPEAGRSIPPPMQNTPEAPRWSLGDGPRPAVEGEQEQTSAPAASFRAVYQSKVIEALTGRKLVTFGSPSPLREESLAVPGPISAQIFDSSNQNHAAGTLDRDRLLGGDHPLDFSEAASRGVGGVGGQGLLPLDPNFVSQAQSQSQKRGVDMRNGQSQTDHSVGASRGDESGLVSVKGTPGGAAAAGALSLSKWKTSPSPQTSRWRVAPRLWSVMESESEGENEREREGEAVNRKGGEQEGGRGKGERCGSDLAVGEDNKIEKSGRKEEKEQENRSLAAAPGGGDMIRPPPLAFHPPPSGPWRPQHNKTLPPTLESPQADDQCPSLGVPAPPPHMPPPTTMEHFCPPSNSPAVNALWTEFVAPPYKEQVELAIQNCLRTGKPFDLQLMIERPDGQLRWFECGGKRVVRSVHTDQQGQPKKGEGQTEALPPQLPCGASERPGGCEEIEREREPARENPPSKCTGVKDSPTSPDTGTGTGSVCPSVHAPAVASVLGFLRDVTEEENVRRRTEWLLTRSQQTLDAVFQGSIRANLQEMVILEASLLFRLWTGRILDGTYLNCVLRTKDTEDLRSAVFSANRSVVWFPSRVLLRIEWGGHSHHKLLGISKPSGQRAPSAPSASPIPPAQLEVGETPQQPSCPSPRAQSVRTDSTIRTRGGSLSHQSQVGPLADSLAHSPGVLASVVAVIDEDDPACVTLNFYGLAPVNPLPPSALPPQRPPPQVPNRKRTNTSAAPVKRNPNGSLHVPVGGTGTSCLPTSAPPSRCPWATRPVPVSPESPPSVGGGPLESSEKVEEPTREDSVVPSDKDVRSGGSMSGELNPDPLLPTCPPPRRIPIPPSSVVVSSLRQATKEEGEKAFGSEKAGSSETAVCI
uniref:PAS fold-3 domain-containing protein n=1 Tax=Chromera velia CCMP2878 TaxID=1169474 RepID=A0A0G4F4X9_9ALVE|eukprot:Cvel_2735.t1-p1 / transcript=Cvel_2735.t1 / gene=Cvel_2735 / organism=Chromera_velia_CCMP2878 / gene_product=hypothetical protein / transcript_product=hypothetical protein / location=Cvel_scaffold109:84389-90383(-) / protein_length=1644 / sequence_SO=supercontig / SO=protein_coding / is_pseudo=false